MARFRTKSESVAPFVNASGPLIFAGLSTSAPTEGGVSVLEELEALCPDL